jgi:hypothetical protein
MSDDPDVQPETAEAAETEHHGSHELPDGAPVHPLIDLSRDPTPGRADHARSDDEA